eukprot:CAMPEP_0178446826 /NCGR_PEP_ID=MMETSP0689_2-20121128/41034_1 /TAXON_ID=160604 /ORGANISM="Amphidinium massartii, Strain CS-259" /LENGTH=116 /DNA_ID=CAMNT_0020071723 /DNA_START=77 /DNA_END=427 /DNA_ORIENTATION=+
MSNKKDAALQSFSDLALRHLQPSQPPVNLSIPATGHPASQQARTTDQYGLGELLDGTHIQEAWWEGCKDLTNARLNLDGQLQRLRQWQRRLHAADKWRAHDVRQVLLLVQVRKLRG